jgi:hypothetical protein
VSPASEALLAALQGRRTRWRLEDLEAKHLQVAPRLRGNPDRRRELEALIAELVGAKRIRTSTRQDRTQMPALPAFIDIIRAAEPARPRRDGRGYGWRPELAAVLALQPPASPAELRTLRAVNRWLAKHSAGASLAGSRERSLEVFRNEKLLDERLRYGRLFRSGILSYNLLRARRVAPGLVVEQVGDAAVALVVENADTFRTVADVLSSRAQSDVGLVAWGAGAAFEQSCDALRSMTVSGRPLQQSFYFGDIDPSGLRIPAHASVVLDPLPLQPARPLYELLLDTDVQVPARERLTEDTIKHLTWLGEPRASRAHAVMAQKARLPQEALTASLLTGCANLV